jgi:hypothetical protein
MMIANLGISVPRQSRTVRQAAGLRLSVADTLVGT